MNKKRKPYNKSTGRNYKRDYEKFQSSEKAKKDRASRNKVRREAEMSGKVRKGDGYDIDHIIPLKNGGSKDKKNTRVRSRSANRGDKKQLKRRK